MYNKLAVVTIFVIPALGGLLFGYDIGSTSFAVNQMKDPALSTSPFTESLSTSSSSFLTGLITSSASTGAFLGSLLVYKLSTQISRKKELQIGSVLYLIGALLMYLSGSLSLSPTIGILCITVSRLVYGVGIAFSLHAAPTYIAEMSPPELRGLLISLKEAMIVLGILLGYSIGLFFENQVDGWRYMYLLSVFISSLMFVGTYFLKRSVRWLLFNEIYEEAFESLNFVIPHPYVIEAFDVMKEQVTEQKHQAVLSSSTKVTIFSNRYRGQLIAGIGLVVLQQITGQPSILTYATPLLTSAGLSSDSSLFIGGFKLGATMFAVYWVERCGRRKLLFIGLWMMVVALIVLTVTFLTAPAVMGSDVDDDGSGTEIGFEQIVTLASLFTYIAGYQVGFGPITWLMISEVFPLNIRGESVAFAVQVNFLFNGLVQFVIPIAMEAVGEGVMFLVFTVLCVVSLVFVDRFVVETRGLTLEEIEGVFESRRRGEGRAADNVERPLLREVGGEVVNDNDSGNNENQNPDGDDNGKGKKIVTKNENYKGVAV